MVWARSLAVSLFMLAIVLERSCNVNHFHCEAAHSLNAVSVLVNAPYKSLNSWSRRMAEPRKHPRTQDDWAALEWEVSQLFDGAPIDEEDLFAGRSTEVRRMLETVLERSKNVILYGEKGVGKTSLSNVFWKRFNKSLRSFIVARVQAGPHDDYSSLWIRALDELRASAINSEKNQWLR